MDKISTVINIAFIAIFALSGAIGFIKGLKRGFANAVVLLSATVVSVLLSLVVLSSCYFLVSPKIDGLALSLIEDTALSEIFDLTPDALGYITAVVKSLSLPLCYAVVFLAVSLVMKLLSGLIKLVIRKISSSEIKFSSRLAGCVISTLASLIFAAALLTPVSGYIFTASELYAENKGNGALKDGEKPTEIFAQLDKSSQNILVKTTYSLTSFLYERLARVTVNEKELSFIEEAPVIARLVFSVDGLKSLAFDDLENLDFTPVENYVLIADGSEHISAIFAQIISAAGQKWHSGEAFMGVNVKEQLYGQSPSYVNALDGVLLKMKDCNQGNYVQVVKELGAVAKTLSKAVAYVNKLDGNDISAEDLVDGMAEILENVTPETVEAVIPFMGSEILEEKGLSKENADVVAKTVEEAFNAIAQMDEAEKKEEAEAISGLVSYVGADEDKRPTADQLIETITSSQTLMSVIKEYQSLNAGETLALDDDAKTAIKAAIADYQAKNGEIDKETIDALKEYFGVENES